MATVRWEFKGSAAMANLSWLSLNHGGTWGQLGPKSNAHVSKAWACGTADPFFITYKPNQSYKMIPAGWMKGGLCLRHYSSMSDTVVLCRPMDAHVIINVDWWRRADGFVIDCWRMSGANCLHVEMPEACNWWKISTLLFEHQGLAHVGLVYKDTLIPKCNYMQSILEPDFPEMNENILVDPPSKQKPAAASSASKQKPAAAASSTSKQKPAALKRPASVRDVVKKLQKKGIHVPKDVKVPVPKIVAKKPAKRSK